ncbi:MAG: DNA segregation ATPase FtsK/SpoIIIE S-DNA-T family [Limisphaerales bacterium]|nr:MAG: DNA segregation ATPase FtsK/SpoIIIE S-DNA-T family [Limisphaerales bacterium]KAG0506751.1 MAG: DNA segregation ATPase FtsK/SpoIIIE S-DNA-T family [Limisphaerales bacterium]TXT46032.1 MAG: DNA segregation ATPase FtsK/SpoIIIE S-DNA-T family [Limisphaerales bacterium]
MARKDNANDKEQPPARGEGGILGLVLLAAAVLLLLAQFSFDKNDVAANTAEPNPEIHNLIGRLGAHVANAGFFTFGAAAYLLPPLLVLIGLVPFVDQLQHLRRRWPWCVVLLLCLVGLFDLFPGAFERIVRAINSGHAGGTVGMLLNQYLFKHFLGTVGASVVFLTLYVVGLIYLTNFALLDWARSLFLRGDDSAVSTADASAEELALNKRAKELEKEAKRLQEEVEKAAKAKAAKSVEQPAAPEKAGPELGADGKPVPTPLIRDLSVPQARPADLTAKAKRKEKVEAPPAEDWSPSGAAKPGPLPADDAIIIKAEEVVAATTADILSKDSALAKKTDKPEKAAKPAKVEPLTEPVKAPEPEPIAPGEPLVHIADALAVAAAEAPKPIEEAKPVEPAAAVPAPAIFDNSGSAPRPRPKPQPKKPKPMTVASVPLIGNYQVPPLDFLQHPDMTVKPTESKEDLMANAQLMKNTLAQFEIEVALGDITKGPTITRYELHPAPGVKLEKIAALSNNIAAALKAERINILAPVPGKSSVGIEVPNRVKTKVIMRDLLESEEWKHSKARIPLALGKDVYGTPVIADLADMPHVLIAGSTGSGKSVCINSIVASLLYRFSPDQLRFVMIDPKVVELQQYNALPHLVVPVVTDPKKVILALRWVVNEMEKRYQIFARVGVRNIKSFNDRPKDKPLPQAELELPLTSKKEKVEAGADGFAVQIDEQIVVPRDEDIVIPEKLSYIVVIIDELADLMLVAPADVEMCIARITQMARAAGIHCIVATQRPSVDVITGVIKANIPARIAFQVAQKVDSRTILDAMGADKLLGKGDMLYLPPGSAKLIRAQGVLITDEEINQCVDFIAKQGKPSYEMEIHNALQRTPNSVAQPFDAEEGEGEDEELIEQCIEVIRSEQKASVSLLQRRLKIGYGRAARIMDVLEERGYVGPSKGAEPRDILIDLDGEGHDGAGQQAL